MGKERGKMVTDLGRYKLIPLDQCVKADWNYKEDDQAKTEKLAANIKRNGQVENVLVRKLETGFYEIVNGNHRFDAMQMVGAKNIIAYDLGEIPLSAAKRIAIETNETRFASDHLKLAEIISELGEEYSLPDLEMTMPYTLPDLEGFTSLLDFDFAGQFKDPGGDHDPDAIPPVKVILEFPEEDRAEIEPAIQRLAKRHPSINIR